VVEEIILGAGTISEESHDSVGVLAGNSWNIPHGVHEESLSEVGGVESHLSF